MYSTCTTWTSNGFTHNAMLIVSYHIHISWCIPVQFSMIIRRRRSCFVFAAELRTEIRVLRPSNQSCPFRNLSPPVRGYLQVSAIYHAGDTEGWRLWLFSGTAWYGPLSLSLSLPSSLHALTNSCSSTQQQAGDDQVTVSYLSIQVSGRKRYIPYPPLYYWLPALCSVESGVAHS